MTRETASRMVRDGNVAQTPEELEAWIANTPDVREVFERDGYNRDFTAHDVFPLLQVFVAQAGGPAAPAGPADEAPARSFQTWLLAGFLLIVFVVLVYALVRNASSQVM
ncbi:hypothetical protein BH23GEM5_BH23GEM5_22870 [soil metagenome]